MAYTNDKVWPGTDHEALDIINRALRIVGEYDEGDTATTAELTSARLALNSMIREWSVADGVGLWLRKRCILILNSGKQRYKLGPTGTPGTVDDFHFFYDTELIEGACEADEAAAATQIEVTDTAWVDYAGNATTKPQVDDVIGIRQDDLTIHWDTVASIAAGSVTLTTGLDSAASTGAKIYAYTNRAPRPHGVLYSYRESTSGSAAENELIGRREYERLTLKSSSGVPLKAHFDPGLHETTTASNFSTLHVWPVKNPKSYDKMILVCEFHPDIITSTATDNIQFPDEWASCLAWNLADEISAEYEVGPQTQMIIAAKAREKKENMIWAADREEASFFMALETHGRR